MSRRSEPRLVRITQTLSEPRAVSVDCPREDDRVGLERCLACGFATGIEIAGPHEAYVRCYAEGRGR